MEITDTLSFLTLIPAHPDHMVYLTPREGIQWKSSQLLIHGACLLSARPNNVPDEAWYLAYRCKLVPTPPEGFKTHCFICAKEI